MSCWRHAIRGLVAAVCLVSVISVAAADDIDGKYDAQGQLPGGKTYSGDVQIVTFGKTGGIAWKLNGGGNYRGLSIRSGDVLGAAYSPGGETFGLAVYQVRGGVLDGVWSEAGNAKATGREVLEGSSSLDGEYRITTGENLDGTTNYTGKVIIKPNGKTYLVAWLTSNQPTVGLGILLDGRFVVAFGGNRPPGVVAYKINGQTLDGIWSDGVSKVVGTETLTRKP